PGPAARPGVGNARQWGGPGRLPHPLAQQSHGRRPQPRARDPSLAGCAAQASYPRRLRLQRGRPRHRAGQRPGARFPRPCGIPASGHCRRRRPRPLHRRRPAHAPEERSAMTAKIPATVITGFLGAGKTTLIQHLLRHANGRRLALVINEFGELGVDGELLRSCGIEACKADDIVELANGCICCTVADDFLPTIEKLLNRPDPPDHIVIETSGLALPKPLVKAFNWPEVRTRVTVDGVIAVVDGPAAAA